MKLAISTIGYSGITWQEVVSIAKDIGLDGLELRGSNNIPVEELLHAIDSLRTGRIEVACVSCDTRIEDLESMEKGLEEAKKNILIAGSLGCKRVRVLSGIADGSEAYRQELVRYIKQLLPLAKKNDVVLLVESNGIFADTANLRDFLENFPGDYVGALWDFHHPYRLHGETPEQTALNLSKFVKHVHIKDSKVDADGKLSYCVVGEGDMPFQSFFDALNSLKYEGFVTYEWLPNPGEDWYAPGVVYPAFVQFIRAYEGGTEYRNISLHPDERNAGQYILPRLQLVEFTTGEYLDLITYFFADKRAIKFKDDTWTFAEMRAESERIAAALIAAGVRQGDHVGIWATNSAQYVFIFWAVTMIGATLVVINTAYKHHEVEYLLRQSDVRTLICTNGFREVTYPQILQDLIPELAESPQDEDLHSRKFPFLRNIITMGTEIPGGIKWEDFLAAGDQIPRAVLRARKMAVSNTDVANIQYTSGTTGFPKGVMLTHRNLLNAAKCAADSIEQSTADVTLVIMPMFHSFGLITSTIGTLLCGGSCVILESYSTAPVLKLIQEEHISIFHGVPTMFHAILTHPDSANTDLSSMRTGFIAGASSPPELIKAIKDRTGMDLVTGFSQTESSAAGTGTYLGGPIEVLCNTVGYVLNDTVEIKIVDPETGADVPHYTDGEIVMRGWNVMKGYYKMPEATAAAIDKDGWLHTGDIGQQRDDLNLLITGRIKDMIIRGGENIFPAEIEACLYNHPKVSEVQIVGVPDKAMGEEAFAFVIPKAGEPPTEEELKAFVFERMAKHKVPRYFHFFEGPYPLTPSGKVQKFKLRQTAREILGMA
ncbi:MAG: AMP-binding protein [Oscillospiraceae bacterium]|jgi:fatty-acyl-CoA synthase|nr:AMP-binding protein [Oscillospiraceae bacterium]